LRTFKNSFNYLLPQNYSPRDDVLQCIYVKNQDECVGNVMINTFKLNFL